jgi:hypothetical protein
VHDVGISVLHPIRQPSRQTGVRPTPVRGPVHELHVDIHADPAQADDLLLDERAEVGSFAGGPQVRDRQDPHVGPVGVSISVNHRSTMSGQA